MSAEPRRLILLRHQHIVPLLAGGGSLRASVQRFGRGGLAVAWHFPGRVVQLIANLADEPATGCPTLPGTTIFCTDAAHETLARLAGEGGEQSQPGEGECAGCAAINLSRRTHPHPKEQTWQRPP